MRYSRKRTEGLSNRRQRIIYASDKRAKQALEKGRIDFYPWLDQPEPKKEPQLGIGIKAQIENPVSEERYRGLTLEKLEDIVTSIVKKDDYVIPIGIKNLEAFDKAMKKEFEFQIKPRRTGQVLTQQYIERWVGDMPKLPPFLLCSPALKKRLKRRRSGFSQASEFKRLV